MTETNNNELSFEFDEIGSSGGRKKVEHPDKYLRFANKEVEITFNSGKRKVNLAEEAFPTIQRIWHTQSNEALARIFLKLSLIKEKQDKAKAEKLVAETKATTNKAKA